MYLLIKISLLEEVSLLLHVIYSTARHRYRGWKISCVNEVQCGTGTEWRGLIGQQRLLQFECMFM